MYKSKFYKNGPFSMYNRKFRNAYFEFLILTGLAHKLILQHCNFGGIRRSMVWKSRG